MQILSWVLYIRCFPLKPGRVLFHTYRWVSEMERSSNLPQAKELASSWSVHTASFWFFPQERSLHSLYYCLQAICTYSWGTCSLPWHWKSENFLVVTALYKPALKLKHWEATGYRAWGDLFTDLWSAVSDSFLTRAQRKPRGSFSSRGKQAVLFPGLSPYLEKLSHLKTLAAESWTRGGPWSCQGWLITDSKTQWCTRDLQRHPLWGEEGRKGRDECPHLLRCSQCAVLFWTCWSFERVVASDMAPLWMGMFVT